MENKIAIPEGWEIDEVRTNEKTIYLKETKKPKWEDFGVISGWYVSSNSKLTDAPFMESCNFNRNIFPTMEEAAACLALSQLCQWRDVYNDGWKPDWRFYREDKYVIYIEHNEISTGLETLRKCVLAFKSEEIRDKFLIDFKDLIEIAKPLL